MLVMIILIFVFLCLHTITSAAYNDSINSKLDEIMATQEQFDQVLSRIDEATNNIADDLRSLKDVIEGSGLPAAIEDQVLAKLEAAAQKLEEVASSTPDDGTPGPGDE